MLAEQDSQNRLQHADVAEHKRTVKSCQFLCALANWYEGVKEIDSSPSPEFIVEGLVAVAAKASVTGGFFAAVTPGDSG